VLPARSRLGRPEANAPSLTGLAVLGRRQLYAAVRSPTEPPKRPGILMRPGFPAHGAPPTTTHATNLAYGPTYYLPLS
jgi:hypothetical protein